MGHLKNTLGALAVIFVIGAAGAIGTNAGDYAALTLQEIEADKDAQLAQLCKLEWPDIKGGAEARRIACKNV